MSQFEERLPRDRPSTDEPFSDTPARDPFDPTGTLGQLSAILLSTSSLDAMLEDIVALAKKQIL